MSSAKTAIRVAAHGYGVNGKRVAAAVVKQENMRLVGVADVVSDWRARVVLNRSVPLFGAAPENAGMMRTAGLTVAGTLEDLLRQCDVIIDWAPKKVAARNVETYRRHGVKFFVQGGEKHSVTGHSFVADANFARAVGRESTHVVSCNTTSIVRTLSALKRAGLLAKARGTLLRRATDPLGESRGRDHGHAGIRSGDPEPPGVGCAEHRDVNLVR